MIKYLKLDLQPIFDQYLRNKLVPVLEYRINKGKLQYRWSKNCVKNFNMQVVVMNSGQPVILHPKAKWQKLNYGETKLIIDSNYYVNLKKME
jgi:hypothetical protein